MATAAFPKENADSIIKITNGYPPGNMKFTPPFFSLNNSRTWGIKFQAGQCMNSLDIIFLILIGVSVIYSFIRGLVREVFSFLAIILGFFGASQAYLPVANWLRKWITNETLSQILGFAILFILIAFCLGLLGRLLSRLVQKMDLSWADRLAGGVFGLLKALLLIAIILLVLTAFLPSRSKVVSASRVSPVALTITRQLSYLVPLKFRALYAAKEKELKKYWAAGELAAEKTGAHGGTKR